MSPVKSKKLSTKSTGKKEKVVIETGDADELPPGWKKEVKLRTSSSSSSTKYDTFYTDPVTGYIFHSLRDVQRYLKTGVVGRLASKPKDNEHANMVNEDGKSHMKEKEEMSETWRNKRPLEDPSEGYQIRSKSTENGKSDSPHRAPKRLAGIENVSPTSELTTRRVTRLTTLKTATPSPTTEPKTRRAIRLAGIEIKSPPSSLPDTKSNRQTARKSGIKIESSASPEPKTQQPAQQSGIKIDESEPKTCHAKRKLETEINTSPTSLSVSKTSRVKQITEMEIDASLPILVQEPENHHQASLSAGIGDSERLTRKSTRLAGSKISSPPSSQPDTRTSRQPTARRVNLSTSIKKHDENADMNNKRNYNQESPGILQPVIQETRKKQESHTVLPPATSQEQHKVVETGRIILPPASQGHTVLPPASQGLTVLPPASKGHTILPPASQINPEMQQSPTVNLEKQKSIVDSSMNFSLNDLWTDPCIEFAVKTLTGAIPFNELKKPENFTASPPLQPPMDDIWTDPCIEFAVKTLTGAIPVADNHQLQFRHQPAPLASSSNPRALHDFGLADVYSKQPESGVQTVGIGNGGLQKSRNGVSGSSGQYSLSRFFQ